MLVTLVKPNDDRFSRIKEDWRSHQCVQTSVWSFYINRNTRYEIFVGVGRTTKCLD